MTLRLDRGPDYPAPGIFSSLARPAGLVISPLLLAQGRFVRQNNPRLPNAPLPWSGTIAAPRSIRLLGLGDSTIAGVGVDNPMLGLTAQLAKALYATLGRGVSWDSFGDRGITVKQLHQHYLPHALEETTEVDIVAVSIGANDAKSLGSYKESARHLDAILDTLHERYDNAVVLVSSLPAFGLFPTLPPTSARSTRRSHQEGGSDSSPDGGKTALRAHVTPHHSTTRRRFLPAMVSTPVLRATGFGLSLRLPMRSVEGHLPTCLADRLGEVFLIRRIRGHCGDHHH